MSQNMKLVRAVSLASGRGSNFQVVVNAREAGKISGIELCGLLTDRPDTGAAEFARQNNIPVMELDYNSFPDRDKYDAQVMEALNRWEPDLLLTLGYMRLLNPELVKKYSGRIINIHPSLLPAFPGMNSQKKAFDYGVRITGATVHFIDEGVDTGPIILQSAVEVPHDCDAEDLATLILEKEHKIIVQAVELYCQGRLKLDGRKVRIV